VSKQQEQIIAAAKGKVAEDVLAAAFAKPRGATTAAAGGGGAPTRIGLSWARKQQQAAGAAGIDLGNPGAVVVTPTNLLTLAVKVSLMGQIKEVTEILSTVPLTDVDSVEVKRMGMAGVMEIAVGDSSFKLEGKVNDMREFAEAFDRAKAAA
jgi:hypothetical protein